MINFLAYLIQLLNTVSRCHGSRIFLISPASYASPQDPLGGGGVAFIYFELEPIWISTSVHINKIDLALFIP